MPTAFALIRGINVGGNNILPMPLLRTLCEDLGLLEVRTYIQSGNVLFRADPRTLASAAHKLQSAINKKRGFAPTIIIRTIDEARKALKANPLAKLSTDKSRLLIMFLAGAPTPAARRAVSLLDTNSDRLTIKGSNIYLYFPEGVAKSKLTMAAIEKAVGVPGTCRNLNTIEKLINLAESADAG